MKIQNIICAPGKTGFFFDDQIAIKTSAIADGNAYLGQPQTPGFERVRQAGESIGVYLILEDGQIAHGDCAAVQYSGAGGRDPLFIATDFIPIIEKEIKPLLVNKELTCFRNIAKMIDNYIDKNGKRLHTAIRYGITQAILDACAKANKTLMAHIIAREYGLTISQEMIPIFSQSGDERYANADKMILKGADVLPHALINKVEGKLGAKGELLREYIIWLRERILKLKPYPEYTPVLHIDVYGTFGIAFNNDYRGIVDYMGELAELASPFHLRIEGPVDAGGREPQIEALKNLTKRLDQKGIDVEIVADEWCNTLEDIRCFTDNEAGHMIQIKTPDLGGINNSIEAILYCKQKNMGAYLGGTCNETHRSAQVGAHIAMAASPVQYLAKPGMGVDEGYMIVYNEMQKILALKDLM